MNMELQVRRQRKVYSAHRPLSSKRKGSSSGGSSGMNRSVDVSNIICLTACARS